MKAALAGKQFHEAELIVLKASVLERSRHEVAPDDIKRDFNILREECRSIPSLLVWDVDEHELVHCKNSATKCNCRGKPETRNSHRASVLDDLPILNDLVSRLAAFARACPKLHFCAIGMC
jgi:hypothetical protein